MVKDIVESVEARITAPYFGYLFCSFLAINWESLFYLFCSKGNVAERIAYFNEHTSLFTTIIFPVILGAFFTIASPYLKYWFAKIVDKPVRNKRSLDIMADEAAKRVRKDQEQKDQIEVLQAKLGEAENVISGLNKQQQAQEQETSEIIDNLNSEVESRSADHLKAEKTLSELRAEHEKLMVDFFKQNEKVASLQGQLKELDDNIAEKQDLKLQNTSLMEDVKKLEDAMTGQISIEEKYKDEFRTYQTEIRSLTEQLKLHQRKHDQYRNLSLTLEKLIKTMTDRDELQSDIMQNGLGGRVKINGDIGNNELLLQIQQRQIKELNEKAKVISTHINET